MPWVKLNYTKHIRRAGSQVTYRPGDTVEVGRQTAIEWVLDGSAEDPFGQVGPPVVPVGPPTNKFGIRVRGELEEKGWAKPTGLGKTLSGVKISYGSPAVPYTYTAIWRPGVRISERMLNKGYLTIMSDWEMAACLVNTNQLARDFGSAEEKRKTERVIGDLRLPVYDTRVIWARKCPAAQAVIAEWARELEEGADEYHSFLRALYTKRAMLCTLPYDWMPR